MGWLISVSTLLLWIGASAIAMSKVTARLQGDDLVKLMGGLLPPWVVATLAGAFALSPRVSPVSTVALWLHHTSFLMLFVFLAIGLYFQGEAWWKRREGRSAKSISETYRRFWILTTIAPAPIALTVFLTGLRLLWQGGVDRPAVSGASLGHLWLQVLVLGFSAFFWDGILGYAPIVQGLRDRWQAESEASPESLPSASLSESVQLVTHLVSWPVIFLFGVFRPDETTCLTGSILALKNHATFLSPGSAEVVTATALWLATGGVVGLGRLAWKLTSTRRRLRTRSSGTQTS